jgi:hypothetical protein
MIFQTGEKIQIIGERAGFGRSYRLWKLNYIQIENGKNCSFGSPRNSQCPTCSNVLHGW